MPTARSNKTSGRFYVVLTAKVGTHWKLSAAMIVAVTVFGGGARAGSITEMDYMTEGTADAAVKKSIDACAKKTGIGIDRQAVPYPDLVQKVLLAASSNSLP